MNREIEAYEGELRTLRQVRDMHEDIVNLERRDFERHMCELIESKDREQRDLRRHIDALTEHMVKLTALKANPPVFMPDVELVSTFKPFVEKFVKTLSKPFSGIEVADLLGEARELLKRHPNAL